jgi:acetate---CoA ligase (ADP-forming)
MLEAVQRLITPRSIAIIGASPDTGKLTGRPLAYLRKHGYRQQIYPVNPRYEKIEEYNCYPDVASLPDAPDVGLVLVGSERVFDAVTQLSERGAKAAIVLASGFGESGPEGLIRQKRLKEAAGNMRLLGPNTIGLVNVTDGIMLSASAALELDGIAPGDIGMVSQSGGILGSILSRATGRGVGFSRLIATGNESDLDASDFMEYLIDDDATKVIALYLEGVRKPEHFRRAARRAADAGKPIVAFKVGRSEAGVRSAISHTGALAGSDRTYDALFKQLGIVRAETFAELLDIPKALSTGRTMRGSRVAVITSTGGAASLVADAAGLRGFEMPPPDPATATALENLKIVDAVLDRNPIDVTLAGVKPDLMQSVIDIVLKSPTYDAVAVVIGSSALNQPDLVAKPLLISSKKTAKPIIVYVSPDAPQIIRHLNLNGIPAFGAPESCATALKALLQTQTHRTDRSNELPEKNTPTSYTALPSGPLNEVESKRMFARFGIPSTREFVARSPSEAEEFSRQLGGSVVIKILSRDVLHKSEIGGVAVNVAPDQVVKTCEGMAAAFEKAVKGTLEGFLVQELVSGAVELILGSNWDEQLGASVLVGLGGVTTEIFNDTAMRLVPVTHADALEMIDELKSSVLLRGFRGRPKADIGALVDAIVAFSRMIEQLGDKITEAEINPLFVLPEGRGVCAGDGVVIPRHS